MAASKDATTRSRIRWSPDNKTLYFDGRGLKMENLKTFVLETIDMAEGMMSEHLLFQSDGSLPEFDLEIIDDPSEHEADYYFAHSVLNGWRKAQTRMIDRLRTSKVWDDMVKLDGESLCYQQSEVDKYEKWDQMFRELLLMLMMMTCGLSGRGTEMTSLKYMNTMDGDRNIYLEHGQVMFITEYHKSMALMDDVKVRILLQLY